MSPRGYRPLVKESTQDQWHAEPEEQTAAKRKKLRLLFDAAAATVVVLVATIVLLRGLDVWSEPPVLENVEVDMATDVPEQPTENSEAAVTIALEAPSEADQRVASPTRVGAGASRRGRAFTHRQR